MRSSPERAVELRLRKICRRLAQDLVGLPQLADLAFERLHLVSDFSWNARPLAAADLSLLHPLMQGCGEPPIFSAIDATVAQRDG